MSIKDIKDDLSKYIAEQIAERVEEGIRNRLPLDSLKAIDTLIQKLNLANEEIKVLSKLVSAAREVATGLYGWDVGDEDLRLKASIKEYDKFKANK